jgi:hypothetical protein
VYNVRLATEAQLAAIIGTSSAKNVIEYFKPSTSSDPL